MNPKSKQQLREELKKILKIKHVHLQDMFDNPKCTGINEVGIDAIMQAFESFHTGEVEEAKEESFSNGITVGFMDGAKTLKEYLKNRAQSFRIENQCYVIPIEALDEYELPDTEDKEPQVPTWFKDTYIRWHVFAKMPGRTIYVVVTPEGKSYSLTVTDKGERISQILLATGVSTESDKS